MGADAGSEPSAAVAGAGLTRPQQTPVQTGGGLRATTAYEKCACLCPPPRSRQQRPGGCLQEWKARPADLQRPPGHPAAALLGQSRPGRDAARRPPQGHGCRRDWAGGLLRQVPAAGWPRPGGALPPGLLRGRWRHRVPSARSRRLLGRGGDGRRCYRLARPPRRPAGLWFAAFGPRAMPLSLACALQFRDPQT